MHPGDSLQLSSWLQRSPMLATNYQPLASQCLHWTKTLPDGDIGHSPSDPQCTKPGAWRHHGLSSMVWPYQRSCRQLNCWMNPRTSFFFISNACSKLWTMMSCMRLGLYTRHRCHGCPHNASSCRIKYWYLQNYVHMDAICQSHHYFAQNTIK